MARKNLVATSQYTGYHPRLGADSTVPENLLVTHGFTDFTLDSKYNASHHTIVEKDHEIGVDIRNQDYFWNSSTEEFQTSPPE
jgi:hypothetical protein